MHGVAIGTQSSACCFTIHGVAIGTQWEMACCYTCMYCHRNTVGISLLNLMHGVAIGTQSSACCFTIHGVAIGTLGNGLLLDMHVLP